MVGVPARREQVAYARRRGLSQRRSCTLLGVARSALGYLSTKAAKDGPVLARMAALGAQYPRFGYRRIRIFLEREGHGMSWGRAWRLWRRARLQVPRRRPRKRIASGRPRPQSPTGVNQVWSYDFVFDWCANGQQLKCLTVTDEWTKEGLAIEVDGRLRSGRVIEVLSRLVSERGAPRYLRSDNDPEFVARALLGVDRRPGHRDRPDRPRQALAERRRRELQWQVPRLEHGMVPLARRGQGHHRSLAPPLQRGPPAFKHQLFDAGRVRREASTDQRSSRFRNGPGRCATRGLRAQARCSTVLEGTIERPGDAGSLNLSVVRRIRAGHSRFSRDPL